MKQPVTLVRNISPPPIRKQPSGKRSPPVQPPPPAAVEAGKVGIENHLDYFSDHLYSLSRPSDVPTLGVDDFRALYSRNQHAKGRHFVIHQHDHPISGVHYDLRLQFSKTSTISFAIPYGLPGNANSVRPNRMAIETRVHNLWNNLIESASHSTGSLLIWDTGEYEIIPREEPKGATTDSENSGDEMDSAEKLGSDSERLFKAFQSRRITLRLHGSRLPAGYTIRMWLPSSANKSGPARKPRIKRRRMDPTKAAEVLKSKTAPPLSETEDENEDGQAVSTVDVYETGDDAAIASDAEEDAWVRDNNAYPGATNSIGSVHQRHWFLSLDRARSGFVKSRSGTDKGQWTGSWKSFYVRGRDVERSVVTGRSADDAMADEGIEKFVGRKSWRPILE